MDIAHDVALLEVRSATEDVVVLVSARALAAGVGLIPRSERARAKAAAGPVERRGAGAGLVGLAEGGVWLDRAGRMTRLAPRLTGDRLIEEPIVEPPEGLAGPEDADAWLERGAALLARIERSSVEAARRALLTLVAREDERLAKRVRAVEGDLARAATAEDEASAARVFVSVAAKAPRGTSELVADDWGAGEPVRRVMPIDPSKRPRDVVEAIFARARRLKAGGAVARARIDDANTKRARLASLRSSVAEAATVEAIDAARDEALATDPALLPAPRTKPSAKPKDRRPDARLPFRTFLTTSGARVLVGRGAADNDALTTEVARPHDLWLHAKGAPGAHVVVPLDKGRDAPADLLVEAAHLAAHFSDLRGERVVDVTYAPKRHVRKRRGSPPGEVQVDREKVLVLRVDDARLKSLLARESTERAR